MTNPAPARVEASEPEFGSDASQRNPVALLLHPDILTWVFAGLTLTVGAVFVGFDLTYNQGKLLAPLDDVYIHLQYGRQLGLGHFFQFNTGDQVSTGASSLLYAFVLGAAYAVGLHGTSLLWFAVGFGVICYALTAARIYQLGTVLIAPSVGAWSALLVAFSGPLAWGSASGMEIGCTMLLVVSTLLALVREIPRRRFVVTPVLAALLAVTRPEGLIFASALVGAALWTLWANRRELGAARAWRFGLWSVLPLAAGAGQLVLYLLASGTVAANGVQAKSVLSDRPLTYFGDVVERTIANLRGFVDVFAGFDNKDFTFPGAVLAFLVGLSYLLLARPMWRPLVVATGVGLGAVAVSVSTLDSALFFNLRYAHPFLPIFLLLAATGIFALSRIISQHLPRRAALHCALAVTVLFSLLAMPTWAVRFGRDTETLRDTDVSAAAWVSGNIPPAARIAVKDVGAVAYLGGHRVVDLIGLTTDGLAAPSNNGVGTLYEALRHMPAGQRPDYFVVFEPPPGPSMVPLQQVGLLSGSPLATFEVRTPPDPSGGLVIPFREIDVYRADWSLTDTGDQQQVPGELRDYLNVGDLASERVHSYEPQMSEVGMQPWSMLSRVGDVIDSGREIVGGERFVLRNLSPGRPLTITSRTLNTAEPDMQVRVNGVPAGTWARPQRTADWSEYTYTVPGDLITDTTAQFTLSPAHPLLNPYSSYTSYGYWFSQ